MNEFGEVIGVSVGGVEEGQNLNFAIPVSALASLLSNKGPLTPLDDLYDRISGIWEISESDPSGMEIITEVSLRLKGQQVTGWAIENIEELSKITGTWNNHQLIITWNMLCANGSVCGTEKMVLKLDKDKLVGESTWITENPTPVKRRCEGTKKREVPKPNQ